MGKTHLSDDELLRALYDEHAAALLTFVHRLVDGDRQLAEDIVQETLLRAWRHAATLPRDGVRAWLFTTARRLVIDNYRARRARPVETSADVLAAAVTGDSIDAALDAVLVADALRAMTPAHRSVIIDAFYRGRTAAEIAQESGLPPGTVRSRIFYAVRALKLALEERGVTGP